MASYTVLYQKDRSLSPQGNNDALQYSSAVAELNNS